MHQNHIERERALLDRILQRDPSFGSKGYLEKIHAPNAPGPGGEQRHLPGPWKVS